MKDLQVYCWVWHQKLCPKVSQHLAKLRAGV